jgi:hypothetical protein
MRMRWESVVTAPRSRKTGETLGLPLSILLDTKHGRYIHVNEPFSCIQGPW